ncbi:hypothetical protein, variant 1 [Phialophora macrospora]|nr:hypothetical protein, variant 1 [Phialophora macrospora]
MTIHRMNSWSRMKITLDMFTTLCGFYQVHPRFLDLVKSMGFKTRSEDEHFMSCYTHFSMSEDKAGTRNVTSSEICYKMGHFEKHLRDLEDPWSCRQTVVYHRYDVEASASSWILIQPPSSWNTGLNDVARSAVLHPLSLHLRFIGPVCENTKRYLNYMSNSLMTLNQRVSFPKPFQEIDFDFALGQKVHEIRRKLHRVSSVLDGSTRSLKALSLHGEAMVTTKRIPPTVHEAFMAEVACISDDLANSISTVHELLHLSQDITSTIKSVLQFRNEELFNKTSIQLQQIAENDSQETKAMAEISKWTYTDSRTVRIATVIALIYLPANLVLAFFSTVFVEYGASTRTPVDRRGHLFVHSQLWIAILSIFFLILGTFATFWVWDRPQKRPRSGP